MKKKYLKPEVFKEHLELESFMITASPGVSNEELGPGEEIGAKEGDYEDYED